MTLKEFLELFEDKKCYRYSLFDYKKFNENKNMYKNMIGFYLYFYDIPNEFLEKKIKSFFLLAHDEIGILMNMEE